MQSTESSPLLASPTNHDHDARSLAQLQRARVVLLPLLLIAVVSIVWVFSQPDTASTTAPHMRWPADIGVNLSDDEVLNVLPPFRVTKHELPPKMINRTRFPGAIPTNAFWTNLLVGDSHGLNAGAGEITLSPYTVRCQPKRLEVSYGDSRRVATVGNITEYFNVDVSLTAYSQRAAEDPTSMLLGDGNSTDREVLAFDPLSVRVQYKFESAAELPQWMDAILVRGDPFVTVEYHAVMPVLELNATLLAVNNDPVAAVDGLTKSVNKWTAKRFQLDVQVYGAPDGSAKQRWLLFFAEERTLQLQFANEKDYRAYNIRGELTTPTNVRLVDTEFYTGVARLAIVPDVTKPDVVPLLDQHAARYPVSATVQTEDSNGTAWITFCWTSQTMDGETIAPGNQTETPLLMMAHPHHVASFSATKQRDATFQVLSPQGHRTLKSYMTPVLGACWTLEEELPDVGFGIETNITLRPDQANAITTALRKDARFKPKSKDPYFFGKEIARQARLVLIAETLGGLDKIQQVILDRLEEWTAPWLVGENEDPFVYDSAWGGLCSQNGLRGIFWMTDFGNGWYNDHHFHYGYFLYSLGVIAKFRPSFAHDHRAAILSIVRDIASLDAEDKYFPLARHFSWFDGHSFASGIYTLEGGKSQESVSEAINAYYGVYLLGRALNIRKVEHIGHILTTLESRAAKTYWQMDAHSAIYEPIYAQNKMTGQVACTKVSYTTWFGPEAEHMHLINMIPFTPITPIYLTKAYVQEEYPVLVQQAFHRTSDPIDKLWQGYAALDFAIIDPTMAWAQVQAMDYFDDGSSRTNALYWIATQPV